jgi:NitT/TauT family transport system substrate-binding protein
MLRRSAQLSILLLVGCKTHPSTPADMTKLRLGFFPNVTHAAALVAVERQELARALAPITLEAKPFNAGPEAMEALLAGALDATYVGPAPAINAFLRSHGQGLVVVAGAAADGAGLVVRKGANIGGPNDLHGKKLASPQLGNTQDVALRTYLKDNGLQTSDRGGDVTVLPMANADILSLMQRGQLDGAWVPEPWESRLIEEAGGTLLVDERERWPNKHFPVTVLVVTRKLLNEQPAIVRKLVTAHVASVAWIVAHSDEARALVEATLDKLVKKRLPPRVMESAWAHVQVTFDPMPDALKKQLADGRALGFAPSEGDIDTLVDRRILDEVTANTRLAEPENQRRDAAPRGIPDKP